MMTGKYKYTSVLSFLVGATFLATSCTDEAEIPSPQEEMISFHLNLDSFEGEGGTRTAYEGDKFESTDQIRMKIICPHSSHHENGELWSSYFHTINISSSTKLSEGTWVTNSYVGANEPQATTYVYTAQNTTGTRIFVIGDDRYATPTNFFYADQSKLDQFKKSDVVWAQAIRQTGAREVHLNFKHKVAKLDITINDSIIGNIVKASSVLTLEGMPDIDGAEIVVGDYYADDSYTYESYNYKQKASCSYENNGKVLGIEVIDENAKRSKIWPMSGNPTNPEGANSSVFNPNTSGPATPVPNTATYTAYHDPANAKHFLLYVPVCDLDPNSEGDKNATFWIREGSKRYSAKLDLTNFEEGHCYQIKLAFGEFAPNRSSWTATSTSVAGDDFLASNVLDGDPNTYWQSKDGESLPQSIEIDMKKAYKLTQLIYTPRQDETIGLIKEFRFCYKESESDSWSTWPHSFTYGDDKTATITVPLYGVWARYFKIEVLNELNGASCAAAAEIRVKADGVR